MQNIRNLKKWKKCWKNYQFTHVYQKLQSHEVLFLRYRVRDKTCCNFGSFLHFYPLTTQKIKILKKQKKHLKMSWFYWGVPKITIISYCSWDMKCDRHNFLSFWPFLALLPHYWCRKLKFRKNIKKYIILLPMGTINEDHMMYCSWDLRHKRDFCHFGSFFALWPF